MVFSSDKIFLVSLIAFPRALGYLFSWAGFLFFFHSQFELFPFESAVLRLCIIKSYFRFLFKLEYTMGCLQDFLEV